MRERSRSATFRLLFQTVLADRQGQSGKLARQRLVAMGEFDT